MTRAVPQRETGAFKAWYEGRRPKVREHHDRLKIVAAMAWNEAIDAAVLILVGRLTIGKDERNALLRRLIRTMELLHTGADKR